MEFKGRTDRADIPKHLLNKLNELFNKEKLIELFNLNEKKTKITIYGEGYGMKIQKEEIIYLMMLILFFLILKSIIGGYKEVL